MVGKSTYRFNVGKLERIALLDMVTEDPVDVLMENVNLDIIQHRSATRGVRKAQRQPPGRIIIRHPGARAMRPGTSTPALRRKSPAKSRKIQAGAWLGCAPTRGLQCGYGSGGGALVLRTGRYLPGADALGHQPAAPLSARLPPHPEAGAQHRRPGRRGPNRPGPPGGGAAVPAEGIDHRVKVVGSSPISRPTNFRLRFPVILAFCKILPILL